MNAEQSVDGSRMIWHRKGNLTSKPSDNPAPPAVEIGGSGSGQVAYRVGVDEMDDSMSEPMNTDNKVPVILHYPDYRGDHAADARKVLMVPPDATVEDLRAEVRRASSGGTAWIEVSIVEEVANALPENCASCGQGQQSRPAREPEGECVYGCADTGDRYPGCPEHRDSGKEQSVDGMRERLEWMCHSPRGGRSPAETLARLLDAGTASWATQRMAAEFIRLTLGEPCPPAGEVK